MDLLKTILIYMTMVYVSSVQAAPEPSPTPATLPTSPPAIAATATPSAPSTPTPTPVPTPAITPNAAYKTVSVGDKGERVRELQQRLSELGYYTGEADGKFGNQTRRAVEKFQYNNGLTADGIAGRRTLTVLYEYADVVSAPVEATPELTASPTPAPTEAPTFLPTPSPSPSPSPTPSATPDLTAAPTVAPTATALPAPTVLEEYYYTLAGDSAPLMRPARSGVVSQALHPAQSGDATLAPFLAILEDAGVTLLPGSSDGMEQVAFALGGQVYRLSYALNESGEPTDLKLYRDDQAQVLSSRYAAVMDGLLYLPQQVTEEAFGAAYALDETLQSYAVTLPADQ